MLDAKAYFTDPFPTQKWLQEQKTPTGWENTFCNNIVERGLSGKTCKELQNMNTKLGHRTEHRVLEVSKDIPLSKN